MATRPSSSPLGRERPNAARCVAALAFTTLLSPRCDVHAFVPAAGIASMRNDPHSVSRGKGSFSAQIQTPGRRLGRSRRFHVKPRMLTATNDFEVSVGEDGVSKLVVRLGERRLTFETGRIGRQAHGAVLLTDGETVLYSTACAEPSGGPLDFVPLKVDYMERFSAAGMTSGGYNKRDGRASDKEILISRLMDRPLRPMIAEGWTHETQLLTWVLSYDGVRQTEPLAITSAAAALCLSHIPLTRPVAGVTVGMDAEGRFIVNPDRLVLEEGRLTLTLAGTADGVLMIEGACDFLTEEQMMKAIEVGHAAVRTQCRALEAWAAVVGKPKKLDTLRAAPSELKAALAEAYTEQIDAALHARDKSQQSAAMSAVDTDANARFAVAEGEVSGNRTCDFIDVRMAMKKLWSARLRHMVRTTGTRCDGRATREVRPIAIEVGVLPRTHGSALFTRGETQALATVTLGGQNMQQKSDSIAGLEVKRFYLQYSFPPSSVGEVGRVGGPGRREVGHGNLAERALAAVMPSAEDFPYTARVESLITESCGSSSMASVCGGSLSLMDAGVPLKAPVAGVAMGLLLDEEAIAAGGGSGGGEGGAGDDGAVILTDILGIEDALGTMDFKVAGDADAITSFQMDIKCEGLTLGLMRRALAQAREGRLHILGEMAKALPETRPELSRFVPKATVLRIEPDQIGKVIGAGGKQIRQIIEDFKLLNIELDDDGTAVVTSDDCDKNERAKKFIEVLLSEETRGRGRGGPRGGGGGGNGALNEASAAGDVETEPKMVPVVGAVYRECTVRGVHNYGVFVTIGPGVDGLVHVSELDSTRVRSVESFLKVGDKLDVKLVAINERGQLRLSRRAVLEEDRATYAAGGVPGEAPAAAEAAEGGAGAAVASAEGAVADGPSLAAGSFKEEAVAAAATATLAAVVSEGEGGISSLRSTSTVVTSVAVAARSEPLAEAPTP